MLNSSFILRYQSLVALAAVLSLPLALDAAQDLRVNFTLNTTDANGAPLAENRYYYVYRPDAISRNSPAPVVLIMEASPSSGPAAFFHRKADQAGFILVSCSFSGNSTGTPGSVWNSDDPRVSGYEDIDYISEVIRRVRVSDNATDSFIAGISKGGHISLAYACVRPEMLKAAASLDEFMGLTSNLPSAPLPVMFMQGTLDTNVPYTMVKDTLDVWRAVNGLSSAIPVTTFESSPLLPNMVSQATWRDDAAGRQVAFVTIIGGTHAYPTPTIQTGYDCTDGLWAFFSQFLTPTQDAPKIVSQPVSNVQYSGYPASFHVTATGAAPLRYQWQQNAVDIPGATSDWLTVLAGDGSATYRVVLTNDAGAATSSPATLTVKAAPAGPSIAGQPQDQTVIAGQPASFSVSASGSGTLRYQWRKNGVNIAGATSPTLNLPAAITADCGASFTVEVSSTAGTVISHRATLAVASAPGAPVLLKNPARARVLPNQKGTFTVSAWSATPMTYQWQKGTITSNMADIPGATSSTYTTPLTSLSDHLTLHRCLISNDAGSITSADEMLFVTAAPVPPNSIDSSLQVAAQVGVPFAFTLEASGGTLPLKYSATPLPDDLSIDAESGRITGTPVSTGTASILIDAANAAGHKLATLTLTVEDSPPQISLADWRQATFGASATDPTIAGDLADPDGDGYSNLAEFTFGSRPMNPDSVPQALAISPAAYDFGTVATGSTASATITLTNNAGTPLKGSASVLAGPFILPEDSSFALEPGASLEIVVTFAPSAPGEFNGSIKFTSNGGTAIVSLTGSTL